MGCGISVNRCLCCQLRESRVIVTIPLIQFKMHSLVSVQFSLDFSIKKPALMFNPQVLYSKLWLPYFESPV